TTTAITLHTPLGVEGWRGRRKRTAARRLVPPVTATAPPRRKAAVRRLLSSTWAGHRMRKSMRCRRTRSFLPTSGATCREFRVPILARESRLPRGARWDAEDGDG